MFELPGGGWGWGGEIEFVMLVMRDKLSWDSPKADADIMPSTMAKELEVATPGLVVEPSRFAPV